MNHESTAALEREAEAVRRQVAYTAETLRHKMSLGQIVDEAADYFRHSDGSVALGNLKTQVRDNPLPLALVGAGLAWFFLGGGPTSDRLGRSARHYASRDRDYRDRDYYDDDMWQGADSYSSEDWDESLSVLGTTQGEDYAGTNGNGSDGGVMSRMSDAASRVSGAAGSAYEAAGNMASSARHSAEMARRRAARAGGRMMDRSMHMGRRMQRGLGDVLDRDPLVLGAIGIAVGAAVAAMFPRTRYEDEMVGPYRDELRDDARDALTQGVEQAKEVAAETYEAAKSEMERQGGLTGGQDDRTMAEKMADIGRSAAESAEQSARDRMGS